MRYRSWSTSDLPNSEIWFWITKWTRPPPTKNRFRSQASNWTTDSETSGGLAITRSRWPTGVITTFDRAEWVSIMTTRSTVSVRTSSGRCILKRTRSSVRSSSVSNRWLSVRTLLRETITWGPRRSRRLPLQRRQPPRKPNRTTSKAIIWDPAGSFVLSK